MSRTKKLLMFAVTIMGASFSSAWGAEEALTGKQKMVNTPCSRSEIVSALREGHIKVFGKSPTRNRLAMGWAQVAFENGYGKQVFNHNFGNVGPVNGQENLPWYYNHTDNGKYIHHKTFIDGATGYWSFLKRCQAALQSFDNGDPISAAKYLKWCGYYGLEEKQYASILASIYFGPAKRALNEEENERKQQTDAGATTTTTNLDASGG